MALTLFAWPDRFSQSVPLGPFVCPPIQTVCQALFLLNFKE